MGTLFELLFLDRLKFTTVRGKKDGSLPTRVLQTYPPTRPIIFASPVK